MNCLREGFELFYTEAACHDLISSSFFFLFVYSRKIPLNRWEVKNIMFVNDYMGVYITYA